MFQAIVESSHDWIWALDLTGHHTYSNHAVKQILGYSPAEFQGMGLELLHPEDRPFVDAKWPEWVSERRGWENVVLRWRAKDGQYRYLESTAVPVLGDGGELEGFVGVDRDITERKQMEASLRRRLDFDAIVTRILTRFARGSAAVLNEALETSLEEIGRFANVDSAFVVLLAPDRSRWSVSHSWVAQRLSDHVADLQDVSMEEMPWSESKVLAGEIVSITNVEEYPPEAAAERRRLEEQGVRSELMVPLHGRDGVVTGCVGFRSYGHEMNWVSEDFPQVELVCEALANVLERKRTEDLLQESEERFRGLVSTMEDIVHSVSADGTILFVGPQVERYGFTVEELISRPFSDFVHPDDRDAVLRRFQETVATGVEILQTFRVTAKDGRVVWFEELGRPVRDSHGDIVSISGMLRDVTERKESESERLEALSRFFGFAEASQYGMGMADLDGHIVYVNPTLVRMLGERSEADCVGKHFPTTYYSQPMARKLQEEVLPTLRRDGQWHGELELRSRDGRRVPTDENYFVIRDEEGSPRYLADILTDISERKRAEEARTRLEGQIQQAQKMEAVGRLAGGIAHDFNNLLTAILGYTELCRDEVDEGHRIREWLDEITREVERSGSIVRQLMAFARRQAIAPRVVDLNEAVQGMLKLLRHLLGEDIDLIWKPGSELWPVLMDPGQIDQLLANLCVNARDAIAGPGRLTVETGKTSIVADHGPMRIQADPGDYVVLVVSDTGCGMDEGTLAHIFEPFFTTKAVGSGTGLGLATVHGIVEQSGGGLEVSSELGSGTTFRVYLPRAVPGEGPGESVESEKAESLRGTETILVVEDEKALRVMCQSFLEALGYTVLAADEPEEALRLAGEYVGQIDLLVTDMVMPGMTGYDLGERLTSARPTLKCLFISGYTPDEIAERVTRETHVAFLGKPFTRDQLGREVRRILEE